MKHLKKFNIKEFKLSRKRTALIIAALCVVLIAASVTVKHALNAKGNSEEVTYTEATAEKNEMKVTLTAAGEVTGAESETIDFSTSKTFDGMCVEENEQVKEGQPLIKYSDGTYEKAAYDGVITSISAPSAGNKASENNYVTLMHTDVLCLDITVPEDQINLVEEGGSAKIVVNSDTSKSYEGTIKSKKAMSTTLISDKSSSSNSSAGDFSMMGSSSGKSDPFGSESSTSYYTVTLEFENDGTILPGMSANCTVTLSERSDVLTVPVEAVYFEDDGTAYVWKGTKDNASKQTVEIGDSDANNAEITKGLEAGDTIRVEEQK